MSLSFPEAGAAVRTNADLEALLRQEARAALIVNTRSRHGALLYRQALTLLTERGLTVVERHPVRHPQQLPDAVRAAIAAGRRLVIIGSGDGTLSALCGFFAYKDVVLGVLPLGTSNSFARSLDIPDTLEGAVDVLVGGTVRSVDLGMANDRYFVNMASLGLMSVVARTVPHALKRHFGRLAYAITAVRHAFSFPPFACRFEAAEKQETILTRHVVVANGRIYGGREIAPGATVEDQLLDVLTMGESSRGQLFKVWLAYFAGKHVHLPEANRFATRDVLIETRPPQRVDIDGEVGMRTPVRFRVAPQALRVLVPLTSPTES